MDEAERLAATDREVAKIISEADCTKARHVFDFIAGGDAKEILAVLGKAQCRECGGTGERDDAAPGDMFSRTWVCPACEGKGWDRQALREIVAAVEITSSTMEPK